MSATMHELLPPRIRRRRELIAPLAREGASLKTIVRALEQAHIYITSNTIYQDIKKMGIARPKPTGQQTPPPKIEYEDIGDLVNQLEAAIDARRSVSVSLTKGKKGKKISRMNALRSALIDSVRRELPSLPVEEQRAIRERLVAWGIYLPEAGAVV